MVKTKKIKKINRKDAKDAEKSRRVSADCADDADFRLTHLSSAKGTQRTDPDQAECVGFGDEGDGEGCVGIKKAGFA